MDISCSNCKFFAGSICRKNPPVARDGWPRVRPDDWCGEFTKKAAEKASKAEVTEE